MKKTIAAGIAFIAAFAFAASAVASDKVTLGVKVWANTWKETVKLEGGAQRDFDNGGELMIGPSLDVRFAKDWFADVTYLTTLEKYESPDWFTSGDKMQFERNDLDARAGYLLQDSINDVNVGFFVAYKMIDAPAFYTNQAAGIDNVDAGKWKLWGPGLGVLVEKPLDDSTVLYGDLEYFFLEEEFAFSAGGANRFDTDGWSFDLRISHAFSKSISANIGVQYQRFKGDRDNGDAVTDLFYGITGGVAYTF